MTYQIVKTGDLRFFYKNRQLKATLQISDAINKHKCATVRLNDSLFKSGSSQLAVYTSDFEKHSDERILSFIVNETNSELGNAIFRQIRQDLGFKPDKIKVQLI